MLNILIQFKKMITQSELQVQHTILIKIKDVNGEHQLVPCFYTAYIYFSS